MRLLHYSRTSLHEVKDAPEQKPNFKPAGLWVSVEGEDDWPSWCEAEQFALDRLSCVAEVRLRPDASILRISDPAGIDAMRTYLLQPPELGFGSSMFIDWRSVARRYDGIIIAPYIWERRLEPNASWYYAWDCASGCIWWARAIESINLVSAESPAAPGTP